MSAAAVTEGEKLPYLWRVCVTWTRLDRTTDFTICRVYALSDREARNVAFREVTDDARNEVMRITHSVARLAA